MAEVKEPQMNLSLPRQLEAWVKELRTQELRRQLQVGVDQLERGASRAFDEGAVAAIKKSGRKRRGAR